MSPIKNLQLIYKLPNADDTFSEGDLIEGTVTFTLSKQVKVKSVLVKLKGDAIVSWEEGMGDDERSYSDHRRYFKIKKYLVEQNNGRLKKWMDTCYFSSRFFIILQLWALNNMGGAYERETTTCVIHFIMVLQCTHAAYILT